jgi:tellurite resistance-related uncharacterized protein
MPKLPKGVVKYSQIPKDRNKTFTLNTIPRGLLNRHTTKIGTWGVIRIIKGSLEYKIAPRGNTMRKEENNKEGVVKGTKDETEIENETENENKSYENKLYPTQFVLTPTTKNGIIEPQRYHKVQAATATATATTSTDDNDNDLQFVVEFYRFPNSGIVDEKREE